MKSPKERMDIVSAFDQGGTYRGAAALCGTTHKTVKRVIERRRAGESVDAPRRRDVPKNTDAVATVIAEKVRATDGRISAKRLLASCSRSPVGLSTTRSTWRLATQRRAGPGGGTSLGRASPATHVLAEEENAVAMVTAALDGGVELKGMAQAGPASAYLDTVDIGMNLITDRDRSRGLGSAARKLPLRV